MPTDLDALYASLMRGGLSMTSVHHVHAVVSKLLEEVQALPGHANGLTLSLDLLLGQLHAIVGPAQEAAFQAIDSHAEGAHV